MRTQLIALLSLLAIGLLPSTVVAESMSDGLRADLRAIADTTGLTFDEVLDRHRLRASATPVVLAVGDEPKHFAGAYQTDASEPWALNILFVGEEADARARVEHLLPADLPVRWRHVRYSYAVLSEIKDEVIALWREIGLDRVTAVSVYVPTNRVVVTTPDPDPQLEAQLRGKHGDAVAFRMAPIPESLYCEVPESTDGDVCP